MKDPQLIPMHDYKKKEPVQLRLWPTEEYEKLYENEKLDNNKSKEENNTQKT